MSDNTIPKHSPRYPTSRLTVLQLMALLAIAGVIVDIVLHYIF